MKSVLLIGLGRFGRSIAEKLNEMHHQIMAVDRDESRVNDILPLVTDAQIGDSTNEAFLRSLGVDNYDVCFVAIGEDFQPGSAPEIPPPQRSRRCGLSGKTAGRVDSRTPYH